MTFTVSEKSETLLTHLKKQMDDEKDNIACKFPFDLLETKGFVLKGFYHCVVLHNEGIFSLILMHLSEIKSGKMSIKQLSTNFIVF